MALANSTISTDPLLVDEIALAASSDPVTPASEPAWPDRLRDGVLARVLTAERDCGFGQTLAVRFEGLCVRGGVLTADIVVRFGRSLRREERCPIADRDGFLLGGTPCRDDGSPDRQHRAAIRRLSAASLLDGWLDALLGPVEARLLALVRGAADDLGPASRPVRLEPIEVPVPDAPGIRVAADDLLYDGTLHGSLRLRAGCRLVARTSFGSLVAADGRHEPTLRRALHRATLVRFRQRAALREATARLADRLESLHRTLSS